MFPDLAEYVVLDARRLWEEFPLHLRRRMQKVLCLVYDGEAFRTPVTCLFFRDLERPEIELEKMVAHPIPTWNQLQTWLLDLGRLQKGFPSDQLAAS